MLRRHVILAELRRDSSLYELLKRRGDGQEFLIGEAASGLDDEERRLHRARSSRAGVRTP